MKIKVVFWGTPDIGLKSLDYLHTSEKFDVIGVVTQPDRPSGRGHKIVASPIKQYAVANHIPVFQPKSIRKEPDIQALIKELNADFFVTFAFGQILPQEILDMPKYETINLHSAIPLLTHLILAHQAFYLSLKEVNYTCSKLHQPQIYSMRDLQIKRRLSDQTHAE